MAAQKKKKTSEYPVPEVPFAEFWTKERREQFKREFKPIKDERGFLKFMKEGMALLEAEERRAAKIAKRGR